MKNKLSFTLSVIQLCIILLFSSNVFGQFNNNLITNGSFETTNCVLTSGCLDDPFGKTSNCSVNGWKATVGTPNLCTSFSGKGPYHGRYFANCTSSSSNSCKTEAFAYTFSNKLYKDQPYNLSMYCRTGTPVNIVSIFVLGKSDTVPFASSSGSLGPCPTVIDSEIVLNNPTFVDENWHRVAQSFTPTFNIKSLTFFPRLNAINKETNTNFDSIILTCPSLMTLDFTSTIQPNNVVQFNGSATTTINGLTAVSWFWEFGDGTTSTLQNPTHTYSNALSRNVCLSMQDSRGCTVKICKQIEFPDGPCSCAVASSLNINCNANGTLLSTLNLSSNLSNYNCVSISGKLIVDKDLELNSISRIMLSSGSEIEIIDTAILTIQSSSLMACKNMWKGIRVRAGGGLSMENSSIADAENAVYCDSLSYLNLNENQFILNHFGLRIEGRINPLNNTVLKFKNNSFIGGRLIGKYTGQTLTDSISRRGVSVVNSNVYMYFTNSNDLATGINPHSYDLPYCFYVVGNSNVNTVYQNIYNCEYGYYNLGSKLIVNSNVIEDSRIGIYCTGTSKKVMAFGGNTITAAVGIFVSSIANSNFSSTNNIINVKRYKNYNTTKGIWVSGNTNSTNSNVSNNTVNYLSGDNFIGYQLMNAKKSFIGTNKVNGNLTPIDNIPFTNMEGMKIDRSDSCRIINNSVVGNSTGLGDSYSVTGSNNWIFCGDTSLNTLHGFVFYSPSESYAGFRNNNMKSHDIGFEIDGSTIIGKQYLRHPTTGVIDGLSNNWEMNQNANQIGLKASTFTDINRNQFRVKTPPLNFKPNVIDAPNGIVTDDALNNNINCYNYPFAGDPDTVDRARGRYTAAEYVDASRYMIQRNLFEAVANGSQATTPYGVLDSFYQANLTTNLGKLAQLSMQIEQYMDNDQYDVAFLHSLQNTNNNIVPTAIWEENEKIVNEVWLNRLMEQNYDYTESELLSLHNVAMQCPRSNGLAVFTARGLYGIYNPNTYYEDNAMCIPEIQPRVQNRLEEIQEVKITPNPTNGQVSLTLPIYDHVYTLTVYDLIGNVKLMKNVSSGNNIDISRFATGMYIFKITDGGKLIKSEKIVKID